MAFRAVFVRQLSGIFAVAGAMSFLGQLCFAAEPPGRRPIGELAVLATVHLGKTADWVAVTRDAVWVGSTGPNAVHRIDPVNNQRVATIRLPGNPCAGLAVGFGSLWVPLCAKPNTLARVDLQTGTVSLLPGRGPLMREGGITTSPDSVWLTVGRTTLARIDPSSGKVRQRIRVPAGSYNPLYSDGRIWLSRADGAQLTVIDATSGTLRGVATTGPKPRFLTAGEGAIWTLNQGDGSVTRIDATTGRESATIGLGIPGNGGDLAYGAGMVWATMTGVPLSAVDAAEVVLRCQWEGAGGDSLAIGHGAIWLTDFDRGTISRIDIADAVAACSTPGDR